MKCPVDSSILQMSERNGIEIDYCPDCRGVWLDRGELDKIIEKNEPAANSSHIRSDQRDARPQDGSYGRKKRESFLGDLFDF